MTSEHASTESISVDVTKERPAELKMLRQQVDWAHNRRVAISLKLLLQKTNLGLALPEEAKNGVFVENPNLYPYLLRFAYQKLGLRGTELEDTIEKVMRHETEHLVPIIGSSHIDTWLG